MGKPTEIIGKRENGDTPLFPLLSLAKAIAQARASLAGVEIV
jgi:hypothetical protein